MKKWKRTVVYGLLTVMAVGCVGAKAYPVMTEEKEGTAGRYMEKEILLPETGCVSVEEICFLEDGTFRAVYRDQDALLKIADSQDKGKTWTAPRDLYRELFPGEKMKEPVSAALCSDGGIFSLWYGEDAAYYQSADGEKREIPLAEYAGNGMEIYDAAFTASGSVILMGKDAIYEISAKDGTVDEEKVREFLELTYEIYHADKEYEGYTEDTPDSEEKNTRNLPTGFLTDWRKTASPRNLFWGSARLPGKKKRRRCLWNFYLVKNSRKMEKKQAFL